MQSPPAPRECFQSTLRYGQVGTLAPGNEFEPKHALIIKDKDDLEVPTLLCD